MDEIKTVLKTYKNKERLTWQQMATRINETPGLNNPVSRAQLNNWAVGVSKPDYYFLKHLKHEGRGWVVIMADELLGVI